MEVAQAKCLKYRTRAVIVKSTRIEPKEQRKGRLEYAGPEAVFGLMVHIKARGVSKNQYAMFDKVNK